MIVPFIGAGLSVFAGFKTWNEFFNDQYRACFPTDKPEKSGNIEVADLIEKQQGAKVFYENVRLAFGGALIIYTKISSR